MTALFEIVQGMISTIMKAAGLGSNKDLLLPKEMITAIEDCGFFESILSVVWLTLLYEMDIIWLEYYYRNKGEEVLL